MKINLSTLEATNFEYKKFTFNIKRNDFENYCNDLFEECKNLIDLTIKKSRLGILNIDDIILTGNATKMPKIKNIIKDYFNKEPKSNINSKEIFAKGATIYGKIILENKKIPLSIGYDDGNGIMEFLLIKGTQFPYLNNLNLNIKNNDNFYFNFKIYYGDRKLVKYNKLLGEFSLENISTNRIVNVEITISFR